MGMICSLTNKMPFYTVILSIGTINKLPAILYSPFQYNPNDYLKKKLSILLLSLNLKNGRNQYIGSIIYLQSKVEPYIYFTIDVFSIACEISVCITLAAGEGLVVTAL